ncbi:MAG: hypothetical protein CEN87_272 [Parcubacteria group bacterium Licking1014_1]|nr:MAG: hypothetical protein CEN87_272 [Parcubacteria group bacterium Licking1014_1]
MKWKNFPLWLKGGIIGLLIGIIYLFLIDVPYLGFLGEFIFWKGCIKIFRLESMATMLCNVSLLMIPLLGFIIGAIIGKMRFKNSSFT